MKELPLKANSREINMRYQVRKITMLLASLLFEDMMHRGDEQTKKEYLRL